MCQAPHGAPDILIVDDDPVVVTCLNAILSGAGYSVAAASSGAEAVDAAVARPPRLVILDVHLPDLSGHSICRTLQGNPGTAGVPVLFVSSAAQPGARVAAFHAGGADFLGKPFDAAELLARVRSQLNAAGVRNALAQRGQRLAESNEALRAEIATAAFVQQALLPGPNPCDERLQIAWRCVQCEPLGGDALNVLRLGEDTYVAYLLDASGHGVPASLLAVATSYFIAAWSGDAAAKTAAPPPSPAALLRDVNRVFRRMLPAGAFVTALVGIVDLRCGRFTFSSAGHPGPVLLRRGGRPRFLENPALPLGIAEWEYADRTASLRAGDRLLVYSDGVTDQRNDAGERFGPQPLAEWLADQGGLTPEASVDALMSRLGAWRGTRRAGDDMSVLVLDHIAA